MNNSINLLDYKNKIEVKKDHSHNRLLRIVAVGLLFAVSTLSVIFFILIAFSPLSDLNKQYNIAVTNLSSSIGDIIRISVVNDRVDSIKKIVDDRQNYDEILDALQSKLPTGVAFESLSINGKTITFSLASSSLLSIDDFLTELSKNNDKTVKFSNISLTKLSVDPDKNTFSVNLSALLL